MPEKSHRETHLAPALRFAESLCASAYRDETSGECNWIGDRDIEDRLTAPYSRRTAALSPELYSGSSGIALFLAELSGVTGETRARDTALAALRRSVHYLRRHGSPAFPLSLFAGHLGPLYVAARLRALGESSAELDEITRWLLDACHGGLEDPHPFDIIGGNAGAIAALLEIGRILEPELCEDGTCLELARKLGDELCDTADWHGELCTWRATGGFAELPPMTGFSHGASGIAAALLQLHAAAGDPRYLATARGAFAFEDSLYNPQEGNWVDTRYEQSKRDGLPVGRFRLSWCHGAPGIALARALACRLDPELADEHEALARTAAKTTAKAARALLENDDADTTLCHGVAGLGDILLTVGRLLGDDDTTGLAADVGSELRRRQAERSLGQWPSGLQSSGPTPCLMVGQAGLGLYYLRLAAPAVPSILLPALHDAAQHAQGRSRAA